MKEVFATGEGIGKAGAGAKKGAEVWWSKG